MTLKFPETLYQLDETIPMHKSFMGKFIGGFILAWLSIWFGGFFFKFAFIVSALALLLPLVAEFWKGQLKSVLLTTEYLELRTGLEEHPQRIYLSEIKRVSLIEKENRYQGRNPSSNSESTTVLIDEKKAKVYDAEAKCVISTAGGKKYEVKSAYFPEGEFGEFLEKLQKAYHEHSFSFQVNTSTSSSLEEASQTSERIEQVMYANIKRLQEDLLLKKDFEKNMIEAYKSIYRVRDAFDISKTNAKIIYEFKNIDYSTSYILEDDYLPELDKEGIEFGKNLIEAAKENLILVEQRITFYRRIDKELEKIKLQQQSRRKLQAVAQNLKDLQHKNTTKIIEQSFYNNAEDIETKVLNELEELSQKVRNIDDLDDSIVLRQHIALFK